MTSFIEQKQRQIESMKTRFQQAFRTSNSREAFYDWLQKNTWGNCVSAAEFTRFGVDEQDAQKRVQQREKNNALVRDYFFEQLAHKAPFSNEFMCDLHGCLFDRVMYGCGFYRNYEVHMRYVDIKAPHPAFLTAIMKDMETTYHQSSKNIFNIFDLNYKIVINQPFIDGNKTIARTILNYELLNQGYSPLLFSSPADRKTYLDCVEKSYIENDLTCFHAFMLDKMISTAQESLMILQGKTYANDTQQPHVIAHQSPVEMVAEDKKIHSK